ncbi:MAG: NifB/NifX family molybdenum-iron cluster-binding protein [Desulfamplus sp.]|nr:NifB/NifX family molybdenum-iron cluster-binding protein [Desulfamplus sp.]MBF0388956.1 NifB/NifX family molybdenum-iron cluster-binding protein [Desulfamplus sp.]
MLVAFTAWGNRISPVFDESTSFFIVEIFDGKILKSFVKYCDPEMYWHSIEMLKMLKIDIIICGAISELLLRIVESTGIKIIPFIGGRIEEIIEFLIKNEQIPTTLMMPGALDIRANLRTKEFKIK